MTQKMIHFLPTHNSMNLNTTGVQNFISQKLPSQQIESNFLFGSFTKTEPEMTVERK